MVFFVHEGKVLVTVGPPAVNGREGESETNEFAVSKGGVWVVPRGEFGFLSFWFFGWSAWSCWDWSRSHSSPGPEFDNCGARRSGAPPAHITRHCIPAMNLCEVDKERCVYSLSFPVDAAA